MLASNWGRVKVVINHFSNLALSEGWVQLGYAVAVDERAGEASRLASCCLCGAWAAPSLLKSWLGGGVCSSLGALGDLHQPCRRGHASILRSWRVLQPLDDIDQMLLLQRQLLNLWATELNHTSIARTPCLNASTSQFLRQRYRRMPLYVCMTSYYFFEFLLNTLIEFLSFQR